MSSSLDLVHCCCFWGPLSSQQSYVAVLCILLHAWNKERYSLLLRGCFVCAIVFGVMSIRDWVLMCDFCGDTPLYHGVVTAYLNYYSVQLEYTLMSWLANHECRE